MFRVLQQSDPWATAYHDTVGALLVAASAVPIATWLAAMLLSR